MKKISLIAATFALLTTHASAGVSVGVDYMLGDGMEYESEIGSYSNTYEKDVDGFKLKVGFGSPDISSLDLYYGMLEDEYGTEASEFGLTGRSYIHIADEFRFFFQGGLGYGTFSTEDTIGEDWSYLQAHVGAGVSYLLAEQLELSLGYDYKFQLFQDIEDSSYSDNLVTTATGGGLYFGVSYHFSGLGSTEETAPEPSSSSPTIININNTTSGSIEQERVY